MEKAPPTWSLLKLPLQTAVHQFTDFNASAFAFKSRVYDDPFVGERKQRSLKCAAIERANFLGTAAVAERVSLQHGRRRTGAQHG